MIMAKKYTILYHKLYNNKIIFKKNLFYYLIDYFLFKKYSIVSYRREISWQQ